MSPGLRPRCGILVSRLSRGGRITKTTCRAFVLHGERRCHRHLDLFTWAASERKVRAARRKKFVDKHRGWTVEKLAALSETRQLDLFAWGQAYDNAVDRWVRAYVDGHEIGRLDENARAAAERAVLEQQWPGWSTLRRLVYERDGGICFVCDRAVPFELFELGHLHDRMMGGSDHPDNVVVMCAVCNHVLKPLHATTEDAREWAASQREDARWDASSWTQRAEDALAELRRQRTAE